MINLILNTLTISSLGAYGASIATVFTEFFVLVYQYIVVRKEFDFNGVKLSSLKYLTCALAMSIVVIIVGELLGVNLFSNLIQVAVGFIIYIGLLFLMKDEMLKFFIHKILSLLHIKEEC